MSRKTSFGNWGTCLKLAFFGANGTGKLSLANQLIREENAELLNDTKKSLDVPCCERTLTIPGLPNVIIMDTSDLHNFPPMRRVTIQHANIFVLVFSVDNKSSVQDIEEYYDNIMEIKYQCNDYHNNRIPIVVVANKCDIMENDRRVDLAKVKMKIVEEWKCPFIEACAHDSDNMNQLRTIIHEETRLSYNVPFSPSSNKKKRNSIAGRFKVLIT